MKTVQWIKKYRYRLAAFLLAFIPRVLLNMTAYPLRTLSDELATISSAAYFAGKDWSLVVGNANYYGFGFSVLFAPLFHFVDNPVVLYRTMLITESLLQSLVALIAFHLMTRYYGITHSLYVTVCSVACSYMVVTRTMIVYNEHALIFCSWLIAWLLLILYDGVKTGDGKRKNGGSFLIICVLTYALTLHTRSVIYWIALAVVALLYLIAERKMLLSWKILAPLAVAGYLGSKEIVRLVQKLLWATKENGALKNTKINIRLSLDFLRPENRGPWSNIVLGQMNTAAVISGGLLIIGLILGIVLLFRYGKHVFTAKGKKTEIEWNYLLILLYFGLLILGTIAAQSLMWLKQTKEAMELGTGTWAYGMKATTYMRYMGPYLGPVLLAVLAYMHQAAGSRIKSGKANTGSLLAVFGMIVTWALHLLWGRRVYPYVYQNTYALECYLPAALQNIRDLHLERNLYIPATILSALLALFFCLCYYKKKTMPAVVVLAGYLMYQYCYNAVAYDLVDQKAYYYTVQSSYELVKSLEEQPDFHLDSIYVVESRELKDHQNYYLLQFYMNDYRIVPDKPAEDTAEALVFTNGAECPVAGCEGYQGCALDEDEYVWVRGERLQAMVRKCGVVLHE
ncbi:MAG: hypothetical protein NC081_01615 [Roseburia sp.]|nr:hypothetical protein [Roseburia sp.]